ncbi:MAG TPA: hypothetical protein PLR25_19210, partial [Planctomycetaceae bacterium]|nr:hypothetical protein [Planctomycetaceae bacterium]
MKYLINHATNINPGMCEFLEYPDKATQRGNHFMMHPFDSSGIGKSYLSRIILFPSRPSSIDPETPPMPSSKFPPA